MNDAKGESSNELLNENPSGSSKEKEKAHHHQIVIQEQGGDLNRLNLFDETQLAAAENFLTKVMRSEKGGIKSVNDTVIITADAKLNEAHIILSLSYFFINIIKLPIIVDNPAIVVSKNE